MTTTVYIDAANILLSARDENIYFDLFKFIEYLRRKYLCHHIVYFTGYFIEHEYIYQKLNSFKIEIVFKQKYREFSKIKANCDVEISHRITYDIEQGKITGLILATGDGDFAIIFDYAYSKLDFVRCFSVHKKHTSKILKQKQYLSISYLSDIIHLIQ